MSLTRFADDDDVDREEEEMPFLETEDVLRRPTPLPKFQISVLLTLWVAEAIVDNSIGPYLNQLIRGLPVVGGDERKVGYYTGIIVSLQFAAETATALPWNRLSDHIGRKPVLLSCALGTIVSIISFGLSRSFWALLLSRCLHGAVKGSLGVVKSVVAELTDETNMARGFSLLPMTYALGVIVGPLIGGVLSRPQDRWPGIFSHRFWAQYPYFLPCLVSAVYVCLALFLVAIFFQETVNSPSASSNDTLNRHLKDAQKPLPLRHVLTRPVLISVANYAMLALLGMVAWALIPLVWPTSVEYGGLNLNPASIGLWISALGCMNGLFQFAVFPRAVDRFGSRGVFATSIAMFAVVYAMFPLENLALRHGANRFTWLLVFLQMMALSVSEMAYSAVFMYISAATPSKRSLGATNGIAQSAASIQRMVGPAVADWLFAFSIENNVLGGNFIYIVLFALVGVGMYVAAQLPRHMWTHDDGWIQLT